MAEYRGGSNSLPSPVVSELEKRTRTFTQKGYQNSLINNTKIFNKQAAVLQKAIDAVFKAINENSFLKEALELLEKEKCEFELAVVNMETLIAQDKWGESIDAKQTVQKLKESFLQAAECAVQEATKKLGTEDNISARTSSVKSKHSRVSEQTRSSRSSLRSERRLALAEAAAAKEQAEYDMMLARLENDRKQREAQVELERAAAKAQHEYDMAILAAKRQEAVAQARLGVIEQSIVQEENDSESLSTKISWKSNDASWKRTKAWVKGQYVEATKDKNARDHNQHNKEQTAPSIPRHNELRKERSASTVQESNIVQQCMGAIANTNERLTASLAKLSLPKCHPDEFNGDATMFNPWKSAFKGMIESCDVTPEYEMNYLCMYTSGAPRKLVDSYRKRRHKDAKTLLKELWAELERRFGNVAVVTETFLTKLKESAKFGENEKKKLQAFSDLCADVASQIDELPGLTCLNYPNAIWPILNNLPESIRDKWNKQVAEFTVKNNDSYPNFAMFASMIEKQSVLKNHPNVTCAGKQRKFIILKGNTTANESATGKHCPFHECDGHTLVECKVFARKTLEEKTEWIKQRRLCFRCFLPGHIASQCKVKVKCDTCSSDRHQTLLHKEKTTGNQEPKEKPKQDGEEVTSSRMKIGASTSGNVSCSKIALVDVFHPDRRDKKIRVYAIIDEQSNASMISPELADELCITGPKDKYFLSTCSGSKETRFGRRAQGLMLKPINGKPLRLPTLIECDNIPKDKKEIASPEFAKQYRHLRDIAREIPPLDSIAEVQLLIGRNAPELLKVRAFRNGPKGTPWAHKLAVGWTICGEACVGRQGGPIHIGTHRTTLNEQSTATQSKGVNVIYRQGTSKNRDTLCHTWTPCPNNFSIQESLHKSPAQNDIFQTTEYDNETTMSIEDQRFVAIMESHTHKNQTGHWEMPLPLRSTETIFPNNRQYAVTRMNGLLRSFKRNPVMEKDYFDFMGKILASGHALPIPPDRENQGTESTSTPQQGNVWYLPHFGVYHPRKPTKIRVVFDSSAEFQGTSLNKELLSGPDTHNSLLGILIRFRKNPVGVVCDIEQMFHSFHVHPPHRDLLRFVWFAENDKGKEIIDYHMVVHLFGNTSSPAVATYGLRKTAEEGKGEFGQAARDFVVEDFYVDDGLTSRNTSEEAVSLIKSTQAMLADANLRLHKIASNSVEVMKALPDQDRADHLKDLHPYQGPLPSQRSLGVMWNLEKDAFTFQISLPEKPYTRRGVLAVVNSLYDPLGLAIPVTLRGRLLLRELVKLGNKKRGNETPLGWDDPLPQSLQNKWNCWKESLRDLETFAIPRCYRPKDFGEAERKEIHAFSDASENAIGAAVYLKQVNHDGKVNVSLLFAQGQLSPKQATTIPRLELCAAVLTTQAVKWITRELKLNVDQILFYSDSKVVLGYIQNESRRFYVYVTNRVQIIRSISSPSQWTYVDTNNNPADIATRGKPAKQLMASSWFTGPEFLRNDTSPTASSQQEFEIKNDDPEVRTEASILSSNIQIATKLGSERFERFSKWSTLQRAIANLIVRAKKCHTQRQGRSIPVRGSKNSRNNTLDVSLPKQISRPLSATELKQAEKLMIRTVQADACAMEIKAVQLSNSLKKSPLYPLNPFLDKDDVLRVGGRLHQSKQAFEAKHPAILPKGHLANLAIQHYHAMVHHQGRLITHGKIREAGLWIIGANRTISKMIRQCVICRRLRGSLLSQQMANLPADRLDTPPPFTNVGFDVFGPWTIQTRKLRGGAANAKRWGLILTCLNCRAVHIEVLETMEASSFICALRRFFSICGPPSLLRCDRGTNFIGGKSELDESLKAMDKNSIEKYLAQQSCQWIFNPPHASHFGGVWERQIGTVRRILDGMFLQLGSPQLTHELLVTLMAEVTGIINSRPIAAVPSDADEPQPLTPNMLLTMKTRPLLPPPGVFSSEDLYSRRFWRRAQYLADQFWTRWKREYLQAQQKRTKWNEIQPNIKEGDIVILKDETPRNQWPIGRIVDAIQSADGKVRKVKVATLRDGEKRIYNRPIKELVFIMHT